MANVMMILNVLIWITPTVVIVMVTSLLIPVYARGATNIIQLQIDVKSQALNNQEITRTPVLPRMAARNHWTAAKISVCVQEDMDIVQRARHAKKVRVQ